jgi:predicted phage terminase large subunit-like protein
MKSDDGKADNFDVVKYPALAERYEYLNPDTNKIERFEEPNSESRLIPLRLPGEALHPERYSSAMLVNYRENMPRRTWSALYQQNPVPDEGMFFQKDWFKFESSPAPILNRNVFQAWDFAIGEKQHNDYTVGVTLVQDENDYLHLVDVQRFKMDTFGIIEAILDACVRWGSEPTSPFVLGFEDGQVWKAIKPLLVKRMAERKLYPSFQELKTLTDKMARASKLQGRLQHGRIWLPQDAVWTPVVLQELLRFPAGAHDDIVDALSHAVNLCVDKTPKRGRLPQRIKSWKDKLVGVGEGATHMAA